MPNTTEIRGNVTEEINKKIEQLKADRPERRKEVTVSFIVEDYFKISQELKDIRLELTRVLLEGENGKG